MDVKNESYYCCILVCTALVDSSISDNTISDDKLEFHVTSRQKLRNADLDDGTCITTYQSGI